MNYVHKLKDVVRDLEEQSSRANEFNGVLGALDTVKEEIDATQSRLSDLTGEHEKLLAGSQKNFEEITGRLQALETKIASFKRSQGETRDVLTKLRMSIEVQMENIERNLSQKLTELNNLSINELNKTQRELEKAISEKVSQEARKIESIVQSNRVTLKKTMVALCFGGIAIAVLIVLKG